MVCGRNIKAQLKSPEPVVLEKCKNRKSLTTGTPAEAASSQDVTWQYEGSSARSRGWEPARSNRYPSRRDCPATPPAYSAGSPPRTRQNRMLQVFKDTVHPEKKV
jgi:hypothetical protein